MDMRAFFLFFFFNIWKSAQGYLNKHKENPLHLLSLKSSQSFLIPGAPYLSVLSDLFKQCLITDTQRVIRSRMLGSEHVGAGGSPSTRKHLPGCEECWTSGVSSSHKELNQSNSIIGAGITLLPFQ